MTGASPEAPVCYRHPYREAHIRCQRCDRPICPDCMQPAAVGFQCPGCVREGTRSTRSGRTAYGGRRSGDAALTSKVLVGTNVAVWLLIMVTGWRSSPLVGLLGLRPSGLAVVGGISYRLSDGVAQGALWQLFTTMFTHVELWHLGFNMLVVWLLGPQLELALGRARFLTLYLLSGLTASATIMWLAPLATLTVGASGAIFGLLGALLVVTVKVGGDVRGVLTWIGLNVVFTFLIPNISWQGHLGGLVGGLAIGVALVYAPAHRRLVWQSAGVAAVALVVAAATVTRIAMLA